MSAPETLRDALLDDLEEGLRATEVWGVALSDRLDAIISAARAESDALRAAFDEVIGYVCGCSPLDGICPFHKTYGLGWEDRAALAPSPAEPVGVPRCLGTCGCGGAASVVDCRARVGCRTCDMVRETFQPAAADPAAPDRCAFQRDGLEPCLLDRDNPRHTGCAHNPPRFLHGQQMACHDFRPAAPEREP